MTPDTGQHLELLVGTLAAILVGLHRLLKQKRLGSLRVTIENIPDNSTKCKEDTRPRKVDGRKTDTDLQSEQHTQQQGRR